ncbi:MAG: phosphatidylserine decarboxylase [Pseudomonadota bacterium]|nr:phosphatidylserine decarboxylase [Pseudomonadota bacterium]
MQEGQKISLRDYIFPPIHPEGVGFLLIFIFISFVLWVLWSPLGFLGLVLSIWCFYFFRDPDRFTPTQDGLIISPADGIVQAISETSGPKELDLEQDTFIRVSIFMSVFDCHVNRTPVSGKIINSVYVPGLFLNASLDKASEDNERQYLLIETENSSNIVVVQIAGLVARRIRSDVSIGQQLESGERIGMIRFGSRVDVYLPNTFKPLVSMGQKMIAGETVISDKRVTDECRKAEIR